MSGDSAKSSISNPKLEQILLGAIFLSEENYWTISQLLTIDLFGSEDHQKIYAIIHELACDARAIRVPIVAGRLGELSEGKDPDAYISMLMHVASKEESLPLQDYAIELRSTATRRKVIALAENMIKTARDVQYDADAIVDRASERLADISRAAAIEHESTLESALTKVSVAATKGGKSRAVEPCLLGLKEMVGKFRPGTLILWGGAPGSGKTAVVMQQLLYSSVWHPSSLFELEMDTESLVARSTSGQTGVSMRDMDNGIDEEQYASLLRVKQELAARKLTIVAPSKMSIQQIRSRAFAHKRKFGLDLLAVDHLKLVDRQTKQRMDPIERAYENARDLKAIAKDLDCAVIALCQFTKASRQKEHPEPEMEDFYGGSLEEHADVMLANFNRNDWLGRNVPSTTQGKAHESWLQKRVETANKIELYKLKDRFGKPRDMRLFDWDGRLTILKDRNLQPTLLDFDGAAA